MIGPAGIGKTRLAWEFLKYIDGLVETVWWHDGRSPAYGEGISFWALGEMVRERAGLLETDDEPTTGRRSPRRSPSTSPTRRSDAGSSPPCWPCSGSGRGDRLGAAVRCLADVLRAAGRDRAGRDGLRGLPLRRRGPDRLRRPPPGVEPERPDLRRDAGAARAAREAPGLGRRKAQLHLALPRAPAGRRCASSSPGSCRACRRHGAGDRRAGGRHAAVRGRDGPDAPRRGPARARGGRLRAGRRPHEPRGPGDAHRADRVPARRPRPADRALVSDAAVLGQSFTLAGLSAVSGTAEASSSRGCARSSGASCSPSRPIRAPPSAGSTRSSRRSSARSPTTRSRSATARLAIWPPHGSSRASGPTRWPAPWPAITWPRTRTRPRGPRPTRWPPRPGSRCGRRRAAIASARTTRRSRSCARRSPSRRIRPRPPISSSGPARPPRRRPATKRPRRSLRATDSIASAGTGGDGPRDRGAREGAAHRAPDRRGRRAAGAAVVEFADLGDDRHSSRSTASSPEPACSRRSSRAVEMADRALEVAEHADLVTLLADTLVTKGARSPISGASRRGRGDRDR